MLMSITHRVLSAILGLSVNLLESPKRSQKSGCCRECSRDSGGSFCGEQQEEHLEITLGSAPESTTISESTPESTLGSILGPEADVSCQRSLPETCVPPFK